MARGRSPRHVRRDRRPKRVSSASGPDPEAGHDASAEAPSGRMRIQRILARAGVASRRACEAYLRAGRITVNGRPARLGDSADPLHDVVALDGERVAAEAPGYWIVNKPAGVLCTVSDPQRRRTVLDLLPTHAGRLYPVGRLDLDTEGLLLLTNDGALAHALMHPSLGNEREYRVTVRGQLDDRVRRRLERGVRLEDGVTAPARVGSVRYDPASDRSELTLTLTQGRKRQIRRMLLAVGHPVKKLVRVRLGTLRLGRLPRGAARPLRNAELEALRAHAGRLGRRAGRPPSAPPAHEG